MPTVITSHRCSICRSTLRADLEREARQGTSIRRLTIWAADHGAHLSRAAISRHLREHFRAQEAIAEAYEKQALLEDVIEQGVNDLQRLDQAIGDNAALAARVRSEILTRLAEAQAIPMSLASLLKGAYEEMRMAILAKQKLLGDTPTDDLTQLLLEALNGDEERALDDHGDSV